MIIYLNNSNFNMDNESQKNFNKQIMRRIWFLYYSKKALNPVILESLGILVALWAVKGAVSLGNVLHNFLNSDNVFTYTERAVLDTELSVQVSLFVILILSLLLIKRFFSFSIFSTLRNKRV